MLMPSGDNLMMAILRALLELSGRSQKPIHYTHIDAWVVDYLSQRIPVDVLNQTTSRGSQPLLNARLQRARTELREEGWIQRSKVRGCWCLTPKALQDDR